MFACINCFSVKLSSQIDLDFIEQKFLMFASSSTYCLGEAVMALVGWNGAAAPSPPTTHQKVALDTQEIALFLHSSTKTWMACQKEKKKKLNQQHAWLLLRLCHLCLLK